MGEGDGLVQGIRGPDQLAVVVVLVTVLVAGGVGSQDAIAPAVIAVERGIAGAVGKTGGLMKHRVIRGAQADVAVVFDDTAAGIIDETAVGFIRAAIKPIGVPDIVDRLHRILPLRHRSVFVEKIGGRHTPFVAAHVAPVEILQRAHTTQRVFMTHQTAALIVAQVDVVAFRINDAHEQMIGVVFIGRHPAQSISDAGQVAGGIVRHLIAAP